jgi:hypothetical protein
MLPPRPVFEIIWARCHFAPEYGNKSGDGQQAFLAGADTAHRRPAWVPQRKTLGNVDWDSHCENMKNLIVSLDDETYRRARTIAAQRDTSVSALVKAFLVELTSGESKTERLKREERALRECIADFDASDRLSRDDIHRRGA